MNILPCGIIENWFQFKFTINSVEATDSSGDVVFELRDFDCNKTAIKFEWFNYPFNIETINAGLNLTKQSLLLFQNGSEVSRFSISNNVVTYEANINWFQSTYNFNPCSSQFKFFQITGNTNITINQNALCSCPPETLLDDCPPDKFNIKSLDFKYGQPQILETQIQLSKGLCCEGDISIKTSNMPNLPGLTFRGKFLGLSEELELPCILIPSNQNQTFTLITDYDGSQFQNCFLDTFDLIFETKCKGRKLSRSIGPIQIKIGRNITQPCSEPVRPEETQFVYSFASNRFTLRWNAPLGARRYLVSFFNNSLEEIVHPDFNGLTTENNIDLPEIQNIFMRDTLDNQIKVQSVVINTICADGLYIRSEHIDIEDLDIIE